MKLFKKQNQVTNQPIVETKPTFTETLKSGTMGLGKDILVQTVSSLLIIGAINGVQYVVNKNLEKKAAKEAASSQE